MLVFLHEKNPAGEKQAWFLETITETITALTSRFRVPEPLKGND